MENVENGNSIPKNGGAKAILELAFNRTNDIVSFHLKQPKCHISNFIFYAQSLKDATCSITVAAVVVAVVVVINSIFPNWHRRHCRNYTIGAN